MLIFKNFFVIFMLLIIFGCNKQTIYSGKFINHEKLSNFDFNNKTILYEKMGYPSFIDPIEDKYFYFIEKKEGTHIFNQKTLYSYIFVFEINSEDIVTKKSVYNLQSTNDIKLIKDETKNELVKRGLLEKVFGGIGKQPDIPTSPN